LAFSGFESFKKDFAELLYRQRGKFVRPFIHSGMFAISTVGIMLGPLISERLPATDSTFDIRPGAVLSATTDSTTTIIADPNTRASIVEYTVVEGDTISSLAKKFGISEDTILWQNKLSRNSILKPGQKLEILPITGIAHKVEKGDTIYSIAKKYNAEAQAIVDYPFNTFVNDETYSLAVGQIIFVPDGTPPDTTSTPHFAQITPNAGQVSATGIFVWPTSGRISQGFTWYHKGIDIANSEGPDVLAADAGTVVVAGWPDNVGYGNRVIIDHGNGYKTLYAHLAQIYVSVGQTVRRGDRIGRMGSTGRSTGTHLHFEIIKDGSHQNPLQFLK
jgi:murein DD-endopeptidase MepM/ murein hydrolase activator NlpD